MTISTRVQRIGDASSRTTVTQFKVRAKMRYLQRPSMYGQLVIVDSDWHETLSAAMRELAGKLKTTVEAHYTPGEWQFSMWEEGS